MSHEEIKIEVGESGERSKEHEDEEEGEEPDASSSSDDLEQSVVYSQGGRVFDQPHRAVYGIKKAKNIF